MIERDKNGRFVPGTSSNGRPKGKQEQNFCGGKGKVSAVGGFVFPGANES